MSFGFQLVHARPSRIRALFLSWLLFTLGLGLYFYSSQKRHRENPEDRIMPTVSQMVHGMTAATLTPAEDDDAALPDNASLRQRFFASMLWTDTVATSRRFLYSIILLIPAVVLGLHMGLFPYVGVFFLRFVLFFDKIIALSVLPILFIVFGIDELSKIMLIVIGVTPTIILDTFNLTRGVPGEQVVSLYPRRQRFRRSLPRRPAPNLSPRAQQHSPEP
jgi:NitT/TauT family transport system permease protein